MPPRKKTPGGSGQQIATKQGRKRKAGPKGILKRRKEQEESTDIRHSEDDLVKQNFGSDSGSSHKEWKIEDQESGSETAEKPQKKRKRQQNSSKVTEKSPKRSPKLQNPIKGTRKRRSQPVLKITQAQHDRAMAFLNGPPPKNRKSTTEWCSSRTILKVTSDMTEDLGGEIPTSNHFMFQEMLTCLENNDMEGYMKTFVEGYHSKPYPQNFRNQMILGVSYLLFYHPVAKDEAIFRTSMEAVFNAKRNPTNDTIDQILRTILSAFDPEMTE